MAVQVAGYLQPGLASSHFFFLLRHVMQPVLERPFVTLAPFAGTRRGFFLGLPRPLFWHEGAVLVSFDTMGVLLNSDMHMSSSSVGSLFGIIGAESDRCSHSSQFTSLSASSLSVAVLAHDPSQEEAVEYEIRAWLVLPDTSPLRGDT